MSESGNQPNQRSGQNRQRSGQNQRGGQNQQRSGQNRQRSGQQQSRQQGRQQQAGQQTRRQQSGYPQGGGRRGGSPPGAGGGSGTGRLIAGISLLSGLTGAVFGVLMVLVMKVGGFPVLPAATDTARQLAKTQGGTAGLQTTADTAAPSTVDLLNQGISTSHQVIISYMSTELAPFIAFGLALVVGVIVATQTSEDSQSKFVVSGAGMFIGGLLVVVISSALIGFLGPSIPQSVLETAGTGASVIDPGLASPQWGNVFINGAITGLGAAGAAVVTVFTIDSFFDA